MDQYEINKLSEVLNIVEAQIDELESGLQGKRERVIESRKDMWREARIVIRDFDDAADLSVFTDDVMRRQNAYTDTYLQLDRLKKIHNEPYFARIDFAEDGYDDLEKIYIGRHSLYDKDTGDFYVYDWRAPISSLYYDYGIGAAAFFVPGTGATIHGKISLKRQYQIENGTLLYLFDNEINIDDDILRIELSKASGGHIKTIINTIQSEQNKAIRAEDDSVLVFGPAGSGKTSVGLHRLAYLLYRHRDSLSSAKVRIYSPSPVFASYIEGIIPELGEEDVQNMDFPSLLEDLTRRPFYGPYQQIEYIQSETNSNAPRAQWIRHKYSAVMLDALEQFVSKNAPSFEDVMFNRDRVAEGIRLQDLYQDRTAQSTLTTKTERVLDFVHRAYDEYFKANQARITELFHDIHDDLFTDDEIRAFFDEEKNIVIQDLRARLMPKPKKLLEKFMRGWSKTHRLDYIFAKDALYMEKLYYEDALLLTYIDIMTGYVAKDASVKHILIDEAQDLSLLHHRILRKLYASSGFTVLADVNQALFDHVNLHEKSELITLYSQARVIELTKAYRSTLEINQFAARLLGEALSSESAFYMRKGKTPEVLHLEPVYAVQTLLRRLLAHESDFTYNTIGILLPTAQEAKTFYEMLMHAKSPPIDDTNVKHDAVIKLITDDDGSSAFNKGIMVMAIPFAKGLEFDAVIAVLGEAHTELRTMLAQKDDLSTPEQGNAGIRKLLYLICTRALHELYIIC